MNRIEKAIHINDNADSTPLSVMAGAIVQMCSQMREEGLGNDQMHRDPALKLTVWHLCNKLSVYGFNEDFLSMSTALDTCEKHAQRQDAVALRRWSDAQFAGSASNASGLCNSIARYSAEMEKAGIDTYQDPALRLIAHQVEFLFSVNSGNDLDAQRALHTCRTLISAQSALEAINSLQTRLCPGVGARVV